MTIDHATEQQLRDTLEMQAVLPFIHAHRLYSCTKSIGDEKKRLHSSPRLHCFVGLAGGCRLRIAAADAPLCWQKGLSSKCSRYIVCAPPVAACAAAADPNVDQVRQA